MTEAVDMPKAAWGLPPWQCICEERLLSGRLLEKGDPLYKGGVPADARLLGMG